MRPSTNTVQAPQAPALQPFFEPVRSKCSRNRSSSEVRLSTVTVRRVPFTVRETRLDGGASAAATSSPAVSKDPPITPPTTTAPPTAVLVAMKVRRVGAVRDSESVDSVESVEGGTSGSVNSGEDILRPSDSVDGAPGLHGDRELGESHDFVTTAYS